MLSHYKTDYQRGCLFLVMKQAPQTFILFLHGPTRMEMVAALSNRRREEAERIFRRGRDIIFPATPLDFHSLFDFIRIWAGIMGSRSGSDP